MNLTLSVVAIAVVCLGVGFAVGQVSATQSSAAPKRVTGVGGIFFKSKDPAALKSWYALHLGLPTTQWGTTFEWRELDGKGKGSTQWSPFSEKTKYFEPSDKPFMINYRVANMTWLLEELKKEGIEPVGAVQRASYGSFAHIMDPEGNKIELWDPNDVEPDKETK